jgi:hypothetical protein
MKLNGWQRLGIIASVIGGLGCAWWGLGLRYDPIWAQYRTCLHLRGMTTFDDCQKTLNMEIGDDWWIVLVSAIVPVALAWIVVCLVRWVRRGFQY